MRQAKFIISLADPAEEKITVDYSTSDGTAKAPQHYESVAGTLVFEPGELTKSVVVPLAQDLVIEAPVEFYLKLSNPYGVILDRSTGVALITP